MTDRPRQQYSAVVFIAQMLDGLLAEQWLDGWGGADGVGRSAGLVTQDDVLLK